MKLINIEHLIDLTLGKSEITFMAFTNWQVGNVKLFRASLIINCQGININSVRDKDINCVYLRIYSMDSYDEPKGGSNS